VFSFLSLSGQVFIRTSLFENEDFRRSREKTLWVRFIFPKCSKEFVMEYLTDWPLRSLAALVKRRSREPGGTSPCAPPEHALKGVFHHQQPISRGDLETGQQYDNERCLAADRALTA